MLNYGKTQSLGGYLVVTCKYKTLNGLSLYRMSTLIDF